MKKYTLLIVTMTLCCIATQCVYAVPSEVNMLESDSSIVDSENKSEALDDYEVLETGQATIKFIANPEENNMMVSGVTIELYYKVNGQMQNVNTLDDFKNYSFNLVSNENGEIVLLDLPYGMYEYVITYAPFGMEITSNNVKFEVTPFNNSDYEENILMLKTELVDNIEVEQNVVDNNETKTDETDNTQNNEEQVVDTTTDINTEQIGLISQTSDEDTTTEQKENTITQVPAQVYESAKVSFQSETETSNSEEETVSITTTAKKKFEYSKKVLLQSMKDVRITDTIRVAIISYDKSVYKIKSLDKIPDNDKNKKMITRHKSIGYVVAKRVGSNGNFQDLKDTRLAVLPSIA